jgi:aryl-alcohol dehydrogenase-like predicted oxidoreductase
MQSRPIPRAAASVSEIGLGCWQIGGGEWGDVDHETALQILSAAHKSGITMFDTADIYGAGRSETLIGEFLRGTAKDPDHPIFVSTKLGRGAEPGWPRNFTMAAMQRHTEASLERLGVDRIDLLQLHCIPDEELRQGDVFDNLRALQEQGMIRSFGASVESVAQARLCLPQEGLASLQIIFNIFRQIPATEYFAEAAERGVALIIRLPLASGLLSGRFRVDTSFEPTDHRSFNRDGQAFSVGETFAGLPFDRGLEFVDAIRPLVPEGMSMAQFAQRWILDHPAVTTVITGASRPDQARRNAASSDLPPLSPDVHSELAHLFDSRVKEYVRGLH